MNIGKTLHSIRLQKGISKNELCEKTGLNKGYVYRLENDLISPTFATLEKMAHALGECLSDIVKRAECENAALYTDIASVQDEWGQAAEAAHSGTEQNAE